MHRSKGTTTLLPDVLLLGYKNGFFPMAEPDTGRVQWHRPDPRGIIPLEAVRFSRSLRRVLAQNVFEIRMNTAFESVIAACADRDDTWISEEIISAYSELHQVGFAHSVEAFKNGELVGGLYGVSINGAFFGESMFSAQSNASKVAFAALVGHLRQKNFLLLDTQYVNEFTATLGAIEIADATYQYLLTKALRVTTCF